MATRQQLEDQVGRGDAQHGGVQEAPHVDTWCRRNIILGRVSATQREKTLLRAVLVRRETRVSECDCGQGFSEPRASAQAADTRLAPLYVVVERHRGAEACSAQGRKLAQWGSDYLLSGVLTTAELPLSCYPECRHSCGFGVNVPILLLSTAWFLIWMVEFRDSASGFSSAVE